MSRIQNTITIEMNETISIIFCTFGLRCHILDTALATYVSGKLKYKKEYNYAEAYVIFFIIEQILIMLKSIITILFSYII